LARMLHVGQQSCFPKLKFLANRLKIERLIERGRRMTRLGGRRGSVEDVLSEDEVKGLLVSSGGEEGVTTGDEDGVTSGDEGEIETEREGETSVGQTEKEEQMLLDEQLRELKVE